MSFQDNLATMPAIDHLSGLDILDKEGNVVHHIPNAPGKQGSLKLYHALAQEFDGKLDAAAAERGLAWFAEHVADAEANAEEDKKLTELVASRNQAEALIHSVKKSLADYGDKLDAAEKEKIEAALKEAEEAVKGDDKAAIDAKAEALGAASQKLGEMVYAQAQAEAQAGESAQAEPSSAKKDDDVVDADFEEVKDDKK